MLLKGFGTQTGTGIKFPLTCGSAAHLPIVVILPDTHHLVRLQKLLAFFPPHLFPTDLRAIFKRHIGISPWLLPARPIHSRTVPASSSDNPRSALDPSPCLVGAREEGQPATLQTTSSSSSLRLHQHRQSTLYESIRDPTPQGRGKIHSPTLHSADQHTPARGPLDLRPRRCRIPTGLQRNGSLSRSSWHSNNRSTHMSNPAGTRTACRILSAHQPRNRRHRNHPAMSQSWLPIRTLPHRRSSSVKGAQPVYPGRTRTGDPRHRTRHQRMSPPPQSWC